jgi:hypothetical protein
LTISEVEVFGMDDMRSSAVLPDLGGLMLVESGVPDARSHQRKCPTCGVRKRGPRAETTNEKFRAGLLGQVNAYSKRASATGLDALRDAVVIRKALDGVIDTMVGICLSQWSASWSEVGDATGMTKQSAFEHWGRFGSVRDPGGQPAGLR